MCNCLLKISFSCINQCLKLFSSFLNQSTGKTHPQNLEPPRQFVHQLKKKTLKIWYTNHIISIHENHEHDSVHEIRLLSTWINYNDQISMGVLHFCIVSACWIETNMWVSVWLTHGEELLDAAGGVEGAQLKALRQASEGIAPDSGWDIGAPAKQHVLD